MDSPKTGLMPFGERVAAALEAETQPKAQLRAARAQLLERVTSVQPRPSRLQYPSRLALRVRYSLLATAALLASAWAFTSWRTRPITFTADAATRALGDVLEAGRAKPLHLDFSEGSHVLLQRGARARVLDAQTTGARVLLEGGVADVSIVHRTNGSTRWRFEAGPFQVLVKGTQFKLDWQPSEQVLVLSMKTGSVELSGSCLPSPRIVSRGASVRLSCAKPAAPAAPEASTPSVSAATPTKATPASATPRSAAQAPAHETKAPRSFEASCETASKAELVSWANAERLSGNVVRARTALLALRRRFAASNEAATAAFTLGRMAFDQQANFADAARWFAAYLSEQPNGPLMGDAAGRLLEAHERQGDRAAAHRAAQAYVQRFPDGPYASRARRILAE